MLCHITAAICAVIKPFVIVSPSTWPYGPRIVLTIGDMKTINAISIITQLLNGSVLVPCHSLACTEWLQWGIVLPGNRLNDIYCCELSIWWALVHRVDGNADDDSFEQCANITSIKYYFYQDIFWTKLSEVCKGNLPLSKEYFEEMNCWNMHVVCKYRSDSSCKSISDSFRVESYPHRHNDLQNIDISTTNP